MVGDTENPVHEYIYQEEINLPRTMRSGTRSGRSGKPDHKSLT